MPPPTIIQSPSHQNALLHVHCLITLNALTWDLVRPTSVVRDAALADYIGNSSFGVADGKLAAYSIPLWYSGTCV